MINFVENKAIDWQCVTDLLEKSKLQNHFSNFGPVATELEYYLSIFFNKTVVCCNSGTAALHAIISMLHHKHGKLRWVVSSFGFPCTNQGILSDAEVVDCNAAGMLDLSLLKNDFDGMIVTNIFGTADLRTYRDYCNEHKKFLVVDSALAFDVAHDGYETISFHHTKPWGFGEGGCAIVPKEEEYLFRSVINFGRLSKSPVKHCAGNWKMSDISAAFILSWLKNGFKPEEYKKQYQRICKLIDQPILARQLATPASVPFLANFKSDTIALGKYYKPLNDTPTALKIYNSITNLPCHSGLAQISDEQLSIICRCEVG